MRRVSLLVLVAAVAACGDDVAGPDAISPRAPAPAAAPPTRQASAPDVAVATLVRGRAIEAWVEDLRSDDEAVRSAAEAALREAGDAAVPALLARFFDDGFLFTEDDAIVRLIVDRRDVAIPEVLARIEAGAATKWPWKRMGLLKWIGESGGFGDCAPTVVDAMRRRTDDDECVRLIGHCGAAGECAVPELARLLTSRPDSDAPFAALAALGPRASAALPDLVALIGTDPTAEEMVESRDRRCDAIRTIGCLGPAASSAVPTLVAFARGEDDYLRNAALGALGEAGVVDEDVIAAIAAGLRRVDGWTVGSATFAALRLNLRREDVFAALADAIAARPYSSEAPVELLVSLAADDVFAAEQVARILGSDERIYTLDDALLGTPLAFATVSKLLVDRTRSDDPSARERALEVLVRLDDPAARAAGLALLPKATGEERLWAIVALGKGGDPDDATLAALVDAARGRDADVAGEALYALEKLGPSAAPVSRQVAELLDDPARRDDAADALARMGVRDERVVASVVGRLASPDEDERWWAASVLADLGDAGRAEVPRLIELLNASWEHRTARAPAAALARLGEVAPLFSAIREGAEVEDVARSAIAEVPAAHLDAVCGFTTDPSEEVRAIVATWLGRRGGARGQGEVVRLLADPAKNVRVAAAQSLGESTNLLPATVEALRQAANEDALAVRIPAAVSLARSDSAAAARALFEIAKQRNSSTADEALAQLAALGPRASAVAPRFVEFLRAPVSWWKVRCAIRALTSFPAEARAATPELGAIVSRRIRSGPDEVMTSEGLCGVRAQAAVLLGDFGGPGAAESLREALLDPSRDVREAAKAALAKLGAR